MLSGEVQGLHGMSRKMFGHNRSRSYRFPRPTGHKLTYSRFMEESLVEPSKWTGIFFFFNSNLRYVSPSPSSASHSFSASFSATKIHAKLSLAKSICFWEIIIISDMEPLRGFQAQSMVSVFIQTGPYVESHVHLKLFLVS